MLKKLLFVVALLGLSGVSVAEQAVVKQEAKVPVYATGKIVQDTININTATVEQLSKLKGVGDTKAQAIVDYRDEHGPFKQITDITKVKGIGATTLSKNANRIVLKAINKD